MKLGAENKKAAYALGGLLVVFGYVFYSSVLEGPSTPDVTPAARVAPTQSNGEDQAAAERAQVASRGRDEFLPKLHAKNAKPLDPTTVDPTLHTELLAKLNEVPAAGSGRDLFSFGKPVAELKDPEPIVKVAPVIGPAVIQRPKEAENSGPPPPPPITLKYYGIVTILANGKKTAFFMDGDEILIETEGVTFKGRYKVVRIGINSAVVEDTQYKHEQTLPLAEDAQG